MEKFNFLLFLSYFILSGLFLLFLIPYAKKIGLVDKPNNRKIHADPTVTIGGISIFITFLFTTFFFFDGFDFQNFSILIPVLIIFISGLLDDKIELKPTIRIGVQILAAYLFLYFSNYELSYLGNVFGYKIILPKFLSDIFAIICIIGIINAYNFIDGIDGLSSSLAFGALTILGIIGWGQNNSQVALISFFLSSNLLAFIAFNLGFFGKDRKIFLGDSGSTLLGFFIAIFSIMLSQESYLKGLELSPITFIWISLVPIIDTIATIIRRLIRFKSPFAPDKTHIHHIIISLGYSKTQTLTIILAFAILTTFLGLLFQYYQYESLSWVLISSIMGAYLIIVLRAWRFVKFIKQRYIYFRLSENFSLKSLAFLDFVFLYLILISLLLVYYEKSQLAFFLNTTSSLVSLILSPLILIFTIQSMAIYGISKSYKKYFIKIFLGIFIYLLIINSIDLIFIISKISLSTEILSKEFHFISAFLFLVYFSFIRVLLFISVKDER